MQKTGLILIAVALLVPLFWFASLATKHDPIAVFSQYLGAAALIGMAIVQLLATRMRWSQAVFGPLDQIYVLHKWLATVSIAAAALHDIIDAEISGLGRETMLSDIAEDIGEIGFDGLLLLGFATIIPFIPYHLWRISHKFIGAFYAMAVFHFAFIQKPFQLSDPVGLYVLSFCLLGVTCYLYMLFIYARIPQPARYKVKKIERYGDISEIILIPDGRGLRHKPGQFAFVQFDMAKLTETHPFTISGAPNEEHTLRFAVKALGDYTLRLSEQLKEGTTVQVRGPYGGFLRHSDATAQVWIGAGIGITPLLAWARSLNEPLAVPTTLFYCVRDETAPFIDELNAIAAQTDGLSIELIVSRVARLTPEQIIAALGESKLAGARVFFCGPKPMRKALATSLIKAGLASNRFHYEEFEIRSGIGIRTFSAWLWKKIQNINFGKSISTGT